MKLCDRCRVSGCCLNYLGEACKNARKRECPDVVCTNADRIRSMSDEELAFYLAEQWATATRAWQKDIAETLEWLLQTEEK